MESDDLETVEEKHNVSALNSLAVEKSCIATTQPYLLHRGSGT